MTPEDSRLVERLRAAEARVAVLERAAESARAFIGVMFGRGPESVVPATVTTPLGVPVKLGEIATDLDAALAAASPPPEAP